MAALADQNAVPEQGLAYLEIVESDRGVMGKEGAELVEASKDDKGDGVVLGSHGHQMAAHRSHDATVG